MNKQALQMKYHPAKKEVEFHRFQNGLEVPLKADSKLRQYMNKKGAFVLQDYGNEFFDDIVNVFDGLKNIEIQVVTTKMDYEDFVQMVEYYNSDTGCELAETELLITRLESYLGGIKMLRAAEGSPEPTPFEHFLKAMGGFLPSPQARWCTQKMKLAEMEKFVGDEPTISYVGIRGDEDREGYVSTKPNIQAIFPFRKNIWSLDVINKVLHNDSIEQVANLYRQYCPESLLEEALKTVTTPLGKGFFYSKKLNALLDLDVKVFNKVVFEFLKTTDCPVGMLDEFPLIDNDDILVKVEYSEKLDVLTMIIKYNGDTFDIKEAKSSKVFLSLLEEPTTTYQQKDLVDDKEGFSHQIEMNFKWQEEQK